jgi:hypothetical protein
MTKVLKARPRAKAGSAECKVLRQVELIQPLCPGMGFLALRITVGRETAEYTVEPLKSDLGGAAARFVKQGVVEPLEDGSGWHDTLVAGEDTTCSCKGWQRWAKCKHTFALDVATRRGWLR